MLKKFKKLCLKKYLLFKKDYLQFKQLISKLNDIVYKKLKSRT